MALENSPGAVPARDAIRAQSAFLNSIEDYNKEHPNKMVCHKCSLELNKRGLFKGLESMPVMKKLNEKRVIIDRRGVQVTYGTMINYGCENNHGRSREVWDDNKEFKK